MRSSLSSIHDAVIAAPFTITFTTAAFNRSSLWLFEASPYRVAPKGPPSSLVQLRIAVWTGDARDTMPKAEIAGPLFDHLVGKQQERDRKSVV